jgi:Skp family chaperone for outer membrane proteins
MSWNIDTIGKFFESWQSNPAEYNRLCREDPTARLWIAARKSEMDYMKAKHERQSLGTGSIFISQDRADQLEAAMQAALERRQKALTGLEQACDALQGQQEPTVRALQDRAAYLRRTRKGGDAGPLDSLVARLEALAVGAGV